MSHGPLHYENKKPHLVEKVRTHERDKAMTTLATAGARVAATGADVLTVSDLSAERTVAALTSSGIAFSEVSAHRASLEEAYMDLTRDSVEFRAAMPPGSSGDTVSSGGAR